MPYVHTAECPLLVSLQKVRQLNLVTAMRTSFRPQENYAHKVCVSHWHGLFFFAGWSVKIGQSETRCQFHPCRLIPGCNVFCRPMSCCSALPTAKIKAFHRRQVSNSAFEEATVNYQHCLQHHLRPLCHLPSIQCCMTLASDQASPQECHIFSQRQSQQGTSPCHFVRLSGRLSHITRNCINKSALTQYECKVLLIGGSTRTLSEMSTGIEEGTGHVDLPKRRSEHICSLQRILCAIFWVIDA